MRTLVIGDIKNQVDYIEELLKKWSDQVDEIVFLGDYFGGVNEDKAAAEKTALWLIKSTSGSTKRIHLLGNQDVDYILFTGVPAIEPFSIAKAKAVAQIFPSDFAHSFKIAHDTQNWLLSHAGATKHWLPGDICALQMKASYINKRYKKHLGTPVERNMFTAGQTAGGINEHPSPLWCEWFLDFEPIAEVNQICAHTPLPSACIKWLDQQNNSHCFIPFSPEFPLPKAVSQNISINTGLSQFILIDDGVPFAVTPLIEKFVMSELKPMIKWI